MSKKVIKRKFNYYLFSTIAFFIIVSILVAIYMVTNDPYGLLSKGKNGAEQNAEVVNSDTITEGDLKLHFISVGQADSIFIQFPSGDNMLVDAGEQKTVSTVVDYIKSLGVDTLDYVLLTHQDADHCGGMARIFADFKVEYAFRPSVYCTNDKFKENLPAAFNVGLTSGSLASKTATYYNYLKAIYDEEGCNWSQFNKDSDITFVAKVKSDLSDISKSDDNSSAQSDNEQFETLNCYLDFLTPTANVDEIAYKEANNFSPIMTISYCGKKIMLTGDAEEKVEQELLNYYTDYDLDVDVLKVGHHGSKTSSSDDFIKEVQPDYSIISCGLDPDAGKYCPWQVTLDTLNKYHSAIYRTDIQGNIVLTVNRYGHLSIDVQTECDDYMKILAGYSK